jgi:hypothetical protein
MITADQLLATGYRKSICDGSKQFTNVLYQKRIDDECGKRYFINVWEWDNRMHVGVPNDFSYQAEGQFKDGCDNTFNIELLTNDSIEQVEAFFADTWERLGYAHYEMFEE